MYKARQFGNWSALLVFGAANSPLVHAQTALTEELQEVVVTAQKRSENLQRVPIAVTAYSGDQLGASGIVDSTQLTAVVPGLALGVTTQNFEPHLRGIGTTSNGPGIENPVALYVDGVYYASQLFGLSDLNDVSQVTVLKGPQGTLFGRNATGGVIQFATREPTQEFSGDARTDLDNFLTTKNYVYVNGGLGPVLASNLSVHYFTQGDGWGTNLASGKEIHKIFHDVSVRNKWVLTPTDDTSIRLNLDYADLANNLGPNLRPALGTAPFVGGFTLTSNPYDVDNYVDNHSFFKGGGASVSVDQNFSFARFVSISAYRQYHFSTDFAPSVTSIPALDLPFIQDGKQFTQEFQLVSTRTDKFNWMAGAFYFYGHEVLDPLFINFHGPFAPAPDSLTQIEVNDQETTRSIAGFGQATAEILPRTNLTLGVRFTHEKREFSGLQTGVIGGTIPIGPLSPFVDEEIDANKTTFRVALDHQLTDDLLGYLSFNRGFKSGGFNAFSVTNPPYKPEILDASEAGLKSEWLDHRVRVNTAAFYYKYSAIQVTRYTNTAVVYNGASAKLYGIDMDAVAKLSANFQLTGGLEWIHSAFTSFPNAQFSTPLPDGGAAVFAGDATGNHLPYTPDATVNLGADYLIDVGPGQLDLNVTDSYNSGYFAEPDNRLHVGSFNLLNTSLTWNSPSRAWQVRLYGRNLLDKAIPAQLATGSPQGYSADYTNPPRTGGISVKYSFGAERH